MNRATEAQASKFPLSAPVSSEEEEQAKRKGGSKLILSIGREGAKQSCDKFFRAGAILVKNLT